MQKPATGPEQTATCILFPTLAKMPLASPELGVNPPTIVALYATSDSNDSM